MCVCLKTPYLRYTVNLLIANGQQHYDPCLKKASLTQYFLHEGHHSLPVLRQHCSTMLGGHVKQQNEQQKAQKGKKKKKVALNRL